LFVFSVYCNTAHEQMGLSMPPNSIKNFEIPKHSWFTNYIKYAGEKLKMKYSLIIFAVTIGISLVTASCKKPEEVKIETAEEAQTLTSEQGSLAGAMKKASRTMRRLSRSVENNDWVEMAMWTEELKENIGFNCVELYMIENDIVPNEFTVLSSKFNSALNKLILCT